MTQSGYFPRLAVSVLGIYALAYFTWQVSFSSLSVSSIRQLLVLVNVNTSQRQLQNYVVVEHPISVEQTVLDSLINSVVSAAVEALQVFLQRPSDQSLTVSFAMNLKQHGDAQN